MGAVLNLDKLRPEPKTIILGGKEIDLSFLPCGIVFDVNDAIEELAKVGDSTTTKKLLEGGEATKKAFDLTIKMCAVVTQAQHKEFTYEYLRDKVSVTQLAQLADAIKDLLANELEALPGDDPKNAEAVEVS